MEFQATWNGQSTRSLYSIEHCGLSDIVELYSHFRDDTSTAIPIKHFVLSH